MFVQSCRVDNSPNSGEPSNIYWYLDDTISNVGVTGQQIRDVVYNAGASKRFHSY